MDNLSKYNENPSGYIRENGKIPNGGLLPFNGDSLVPSFPSENATSAQELIERKQGTSSETEKPVSWREPVKTENLWFDQEIAGLNLSDERKNLVKAFLEKPENINARKGILEYLSKDYKQNQEPKWFSGGDFLAHLENKVRPVYLQKVEAKKKIQTETRRRVEEEARKPKSAPKVANPEPKPQPPKKPTLAPAKSEAKKEHIPYTFKDSEGTIYSTKDKDGKDLGGTITKNTDPKAKEKYLLNGRGFIKNKKGDEYVGEVKDNKSEGEGVSVAYSRNTVMRGVWGNNALKSGEVRIYKDSIKEEDGWVKKEKLTSVKILKDEEIISEEEWKDGVITKIKDKEGVREWTFDENKNLIDGIWTKPDKTVEKWSGGKLESVAPVAATTPTSAPDSAEKAEPSRLEKISGLVRDIPDIKDAPVDGPINWVQAIQERSDLRVESGDEIYIIGKKGAPDTRIFLAFNGGNWFVFQSGNRISASDPTWSWSFLKNTPKGKLALALR